MPTLSPGRAAGLVGAALLGGIVGVPTTAYAAPETPSGTYQVSYNDPDVPDETWTLSPCGTNCTTADNTDGSKTPHAWEFHLKNGQWTFHEEKDFDCKYSDSEPQQKMTVDVSFDAATLAGHWKDGPSGECGPMEHEDLSIQLTKAE